MKVQLSRILIVLVISVRFLLPSLSAQQARVNVSGSWRAGHYVLTQNGDTVTSEGDYGHADGYFTGPYTFKMKWASATWIATVTPDSNRIDWNNISTWTRGQANKTQKTGVLTVPHAHGNCTTNACSPSSGCASCVTLTVYLPLSAQVVASRCYTNAGGPGGDSGSPQQVACGDLDAWATFEAPKQYTTPSNTVVETVFHNRSSDRDRLVELQVDWQ